MWIALSLAAYVITNIGGAPCSYQSIERDELKLKVAKGSHEIFVMQVKAQTKKSRGAIVFMHGAGSGSSAIWDLRHSDYSVMKYFACRGFDTYALDARGFGGSSMPEEMLQPAEKSPPAVRAYQVQEDLDAVIDYARKNSGSKQVDLVAWSWGCVVSGMYAGNQPEKIRRLVLFAPVYDRKNPKRHKTKKAWRKLNKTEILKYFVEQREEKQVWIEHINAMFRFTKNEDLRLPNGPYQDIYGAGSPIWDAGKVRSPTLIIRGDQDRASTHESVQNLYHALKNTKLRQWITVAGANHFLPRERGHHQFKAILGSFLEPAQLSVPVVNKDQENNLK